MKVYCALECCRHHATSSDTVGFVDFPSSACELRRWLALTWVRHVVRGVTRLCTDHFLPEQLEPDPDWQAMYPGQVNPNPRLRPGVLPTLGVPGWIDQSELEVEQEPSEPPSMFVRQEGSTARRVRPTERLRQAHPELFDGLSPAPPVVRRSRGRPPKGRRGRPPDRRPPSPPLDLSDPEVRARLVQQALDEYDWRQARAIESGVVRAADGTETLYVSVPSSDEEEESGARPVGQRPARGGMAVRSRRGRGLTRRRAGHCATGERSVSKRPRAESEEEPPLAERLPPNTSQRFREVLAAQREVQALTKQLEATPAPLEEPLPSEDGDGSLMVLRDEAVSAATLPPDGDNYSTPANLELALSQLHQQRLENLRLRADLLRAAIRERERAVQLASARRQAAEATRLFDDRLGDIFTPAQLKIIQNKSLRRTHMWDTVDIKRAIGLLRLCSRRAYVYVKDVLRVPLPGLAVLRGSSQRDPETALMYAEMVDGHRLKHMTRRARLSRPTKVSVKSHDPRPLAEETTTNDDHVDHKYIVFTAEGDEVHPTAQAADAADLLQSVQVAQAAGRAVLVDASGAPLLVDRATGQSPPPSAPVPPPPPPAAPPQPPPPPPDDHYLVLVPDDEEQEEAPSPSAPARSPPHRPGILRGSIESREPSAPPPSRPRFKLMVKDDGEVTTEDGQPLEEVSWPTSLQWMDGAQVNFTEGPV